MAVKAYLGDGDWHLLAEYTEVESGTRSSRPELQKAVACARQHQATLIIAKMDRLGRRAAYALNLLCSSGIRFVFTDMPKASELEIHSRAVVAAEESRMISERTKAALAAARARGVKLGAYGATLARTNRKRALGRAWILSPTLAQLRVQGITSVRGIAAALNRQGTPTPRAGARWHVQTVHNLLRRIRELEALGQSART